MNVASLELCKELYELSGWGDTHAFYRKYADYELMFNGELDDSYDAISADFGQIDDVAAYDLGYILRKLPHSIEVRNHLLDENIRSIKEAGWAYDVASRITTTAGTLEDAVTKLAIELFKQGILTKEQS